MKAFERIRSFAEYLGDVTNLRVRPIVRASQYDGLFYRQTDLAGRTGIRVASTRWDSVWLSVDRLGPSDPPAPPADIQGWINVGPDPEQEPRRQDHMTVNLPAEEAETFVASGRVAREDVQPQSEGDGDAPMGDRQADVTLRLEAFPELAAKIDDYVEQTWRDWANEEIPRREAMKIYDELSAFGQTTNSGSGSDPLELVWGVGALRWDNEKLGSIDHPVVEIAVEVDIEKMSEKISIRPRWQSARIAESFLGLLPGDGIAKFIESERARISELIDAGEKITPFRRESFEPILLNCAAQIDPVGVYRPRQDGHAWHGSDADAPSQPIVSDGWSLYTRPKVEPVPMEDAEIAPTPTEDTRAEPVADAGMEAEPAAETQDEAASPDFQPEPGPSGAGREEADPEAPEPEHGGAPARELPSIKISLAGPASKRRSSKAVSRPKALGAIGGLALVGIAVAIYAMMPSKEEREAQRQEQTLATVEGSQPSGLSPRGELADYFNLTSRRTDDQRADKEQAIKGEIVLWSLPVQSVSKQPDDGVYKLQTSAFMDTVGTVVTLHTRNEAERQIVENLETGDWITIKGKIRGVASHDVEIIDAIPIAK